MPHKHIEKRIGKRKILVAIRDLDCGRRSCFRLMIKPNGEYCCKTRELFGCPPQSRLPIGKKD
jgi:hypothetical protein